MTIPTSPGKLTAIVPMRFAATELFLAGLLSVAVLT